MSKSRVDQVSFQQKCRPDTCFKKKTTCENAEYLPARPRKVHQKVCCVIWLSVHDEKKKHSWISLFKKKKNQCHE